MRRAAPPALLGLALVGAACAVDTRELDRPVDAGAWVERQRKTRLPGDLLPASPAQRPDGPLAIDLAMVLRLCGANSLDIELARSEAREAAFAADAAAGRMLPFVTPRLGYFNHQGQTQATSGAFLDVDKQNMTAGAGVAVVLSPGEAWFEAAAARRRAELASASYRAGVDATLARAADAYFALAVAEARRAITADDARAAEETARVERDRLAAGAGLAATVARAEARVAEVEGLLAGVRGEVATRSAELVLALGLDPGTELVPDLADAVIVLELVDVEDLDVLLGRALARHPELAAADSAIAAAEIEAERTRWGWLLPELRASAEFDEFGREFGNLEARENYGVDLSWELHLGLPSRHRANVERRVRAGLQRAATRDRVAAGIVVARVRARAATARIGADRRAVEAARKTLELVRARHEAGAGLLLEVLDAQAALARARSDLVTAIADHNRAQYELLRAVGGPAGLPP